AGFETDVTSGWTLKQVSPAAATLTRDATRPAVGTAAAKIHITTAGTAEWSVYLSSLGQLNVFAGSSYAATFWARASAPRIVHVIAGNSGGHAYVSIDTT